MDVALEIVALITVVAAGAAGARRIGVSAPLLLTLVGVAASYIPHVPRVELSAEVVLVGFLPPLLYAASIRTSLVDFRRNRRAIGLLSVGLVVFSAVGVGLVAWWLLPVPFPAALALGAVVAPPDAVAATAVARRVGMPRRIVNILEGESMLNDATALVCLRTAIAAFAGTVTVWSVGWDFLRSAGGGLLVGLVVAFVVAKVRRLIKDPVLDTSVGLVTPFVAYLPAEELHASGVLAVVVTGVLLGHKAFVLQSAASRISERTNWRTVEFLLENTVFLLIGLQARWILEGLADSDLSPGRIAAGTLGVIAAVVLLRPVWVFPATYLPRWLIPAVRRADPSPPWTYPAVISWAGMRGVVTLAAVFVLPGDTPYREVLVFAALVVVGGTLLLQGFTLPMLVRLLRLAGPDPAEDALQEAAVLQAAHKAAWSELKDVLSETDDDAVVKQLKARGEARTQAAWERLGRPESEAETPSEAYRRLRMVMLDAERRHILKVRNQGLIAGEVLERALVSLDIEESILDRAEEDDVGGRNTDLRAPGNLAGCEHLEEAPQVVTPNTPDGCEECLRDGTSWVHLRLCLGCGHVGCCDSSPNRHASKHFRGTEHPVMRSFEPGEAWRWCFVDSKLG
ncbi:MAG TPA: Na+/H+ antiporter [Kribbellaceae bacterium]